ncbi:immunity 22 family protein [Capnocytophaga canimorsus]|nr:immunity 22 family protein [Capnocytophaga canimorsus]WGU67806.1 immunity 22 family protein [Capnocytophaga canimorsus]
MSVKKENIICSPFSIDVGLEYDYDPDFIGFYFNEKSQNLEEVLQQQPAIDSIDQIKRDCFQKGY